MMAGDRSGRRPALGLDWFPESLPDGTDCSPAVLRTHDGASVSGLLYRKGRPRTVVSIMHPREFVAFHYLVPPLLAAGYAVWAQTARSVGNDLRLEHEQAVLDAGAGQGFLRGQGFEAHVLLGNSGGAGLFCFYHQQSRLAPAQRLARTPAGRPVDLAGAELPVADALLLLAPHPGQGRLLMGCIDPSVTDEGDPLSVDPALDMFNPDNGWRPAGQDTRYSADFVARYRAAQRLRVARIDAVAQDMVATRRGSRKAASDDAAGRDRRGLLGPILTVWRTDADLRCWDLGLDPSDRRQGSILHPDLMASNYGTIGFGRLCTPESWLSTWSGLTSPAALAATLPAATLPTLLVEYSGDQSTFPGTTRELAALIPAADLTHVRVRGDHHGRAIAGDEPPGRGLAAAQIIQWLDRRFPK